MALKNTGKWLEASFTWRTYRIAYFLQTLMHEDGINEDSSELKNVEVQINSD